MVILRNVAVTRPADGRFVVRDLRLVSPSGSSDVLVKCLRDHLVVPALINAHDHLHQNCVPPLPQSRPFRNSYEWAGSFQSHFDDPGVKVALSASLATRYWHGALKNALSGVTTVMHHDAPHETLLAAGFPIHVPRPICWAHSLHLPYGPAVVESFQAAAWHTPWFIHLAEGVDALAGGELYELEQLGCLNRNTVLVHGVGLDDRDVEAVLHAGASVVWCPSSNLQLLGQSIAPRRLRTLFAAGRLALGTDSRLTGSRDLLEELRIAASCSDFSPLELLQLVTDRARRVLHTACSNDWVVVRRTAGDPIADFCRMGREHLRAVIRNAEPVVTDPDFADWFDALAIPWVAMRLNGHPKLCRRDALGPDGAAAWALEPGLTRQ